MRGQESERGESFLDAFADLPDPRTRSCMHQLDELLFAALCAITSGADSWAEVVQWTERLRVFRSCPRITPKGPCSSLQMLAIARAMAALCA
ncbi:MAG: transposase family protein [Burkholderiales bacterium]|jgi:predicted transposase YbfD/YdcC|nr:transposase family protein [Burkholderiales bacterium]